MDSGSSWDILFIKVARKTGVAKENLRHFKTIYINWFLGRSYFPVVSIELMVYVGDNPWQKNVRSTFLIMDSPSSYNVILRRPTLNRLGAVVLTHLLRFQPPTIEKTRVVVGDQRA
ncbi:hypothetical protein LguiB_027810 [Lonicera macranthoides]